VTITNAAREHGTRGAALLFKIPEPIYVARQHDRRQRSLGHAASPQALARPVVADLHARLARA
jgi:hypothetical protein